ncbi:MAG: phosphonate C-P lyase system protein PhnG [Agrobacterium sp. SCN 61-19]|nr:MAG: phosphonate C-P lyase system protein PhnG [Agrobacterium sp. SCN 61-19]
MFNEAGNGGADHAATLSTLARARPEKLKAIAEIVLDRLAEIEVIANRTGLVMIPMRDSVENVDFHLGEVLVSEAHIRDAQGHVGYGMVAGRDLERAMAMAVIDLHLAIAGHDDAVARFLTEERSNALAEDDLRMRQVEATRVEMETF